MTRQQLSFKARQKKKKMNTSTFENSRFVSLKRSLNPRSARLERGAHALHGRTNTHASAKHKHGGLESVTCRPRGPVCRRVLDCHIWRRRARRPAVTDVSSWLAGRPEPPDQIGLRGRRGRGGTAVGIRGQWKRAGRLNPVCGGEEVQAGAR